MIAASNPTALVEAAASIIAVFVAVIYGYGGWQDRRHRRREQESRRELQRTATGVATLLGIDPANPAAIRTDRDHPSVVDRLDNIQETITANRRISDRFALAFWIHVSDHHGHVIPEDLMSEGMRDLASYRNKRSTRPDLYQP